MARKKIKQGSKKNEALTKSFFLAQMNAFGSNFEKKLEETKKHLELKIDYSRQDSRDYVESVTTRINNRIDLLSGRMFKVESRLESVESVVLEINRDVKVISRKVDQHDREITALEETIAHP